MYLKVVDIAPFKTPVHIGIIPDGNRRFAVRLMKKPWKGHEWGVKKFRTFMEWCKEYGIHDITFYALSLENLNKRPQNEVDFLLNLARKELKSIMKPNSFIHKNNVRLSFFGSLDLLPKDLVQMINDATEETSGYNGFRLNIALAYGGRQEIVEACRRIASQALSGKLSPESITEDTVKHNLMTNGSGDPDLIIRTGKEKRLSNFLIFQSAYSELAFLDCFWPELTKQDFCSVLEGFSRTDRRFGK